MLTLHPDRFFTAIRPLFSGKFTTGQVASLNALLNEGANVLPNVQALAYLLATAWHETGHTMMPVREGGQGRGYDYGQALDMGGGPGRRIPYKTPPMLYYYGRGYVQLTWRCNYQAMGRITGTDLLNNPDLAMQPVVATQIAVQGMLRGYFTGKRLKDYFPTPSGKHDPLNARRIINGMDCAAKIAGYYNTFLTALLA
jgi:putative chitinase